MPGRDLSERLTVVLLTHNCRDRVRTVLDRLQRLQVPIIVVDNASTDGTWEYLDQVASPPGLASVRLPSNIGAAARNIGADRASTPYIAFCDDDGWYDGAGLADACDLLDAHPRLGLVNAHILVGDTERLDPITAEMRDSPLVDRLGIPGRVLLGFMAGACVVRRAAFLGVGGYDERFFIGGEEEHVALALAQAGWQLRYVESVVMHHHPSLANFSRLRAFGLRNTLWTAWLNRRLRSALRYTWFTIVDTPKDKDYVKGMIMAVRGLGWVVHERSPMSRQLDADLRRLDERRYAERRRFLTLRQPGASHPSSWPESSEVSATSAEAVPADATAVSDLAEVR